MSPIDGGGLEEDILRKPLVEIKKGKSPEKMHLNCPFALTTEYEAKSKT